MSNNPTIAVIGFMRFPPERVAEIVPHVRTLVEASNREEGCIAYRVGVDIQDPGVLRVSELWADAAALARHVQEPHIAPWHVAQQLCGIIEREYKIIDIASIRTV